MRGVLVPSLHELERAYSELLKPKALLGDFQLSSKLLLWCQWARIDARLAEILVRFFSEHFEQLPAQEIAEENALQPTPQALCVLLEFAIARLGAEKMSKSKQKQFELFYRQLTFAQVSAAPQFFFITQGMQIPSPGASVVSSSMRPYLRWGFFGSEDLAQVYKLEKTDQGPGVTLLGRLQRQSKIKEFVQNRSEVTISEYRNFCQGQVSKRTAERDFADCDFLRKIGNTRASRYQVLKKR